MTDAMTTAGRRVPPPLAFAAWRSEVRATAALAWPIALTFLSEMAIATTDTIIIGRLGAEALAAAALGLTTFFVFFFLAIGITMATAPLAAQALGARRPRLVRRVIRQGLWVGLVLSLPASVGLMFAEPVLLALGQPPEAARGAQVYLNVFAWSLPFAVGFTVLRNFAAALERPRLGLWVILAGIPLNAVLDYGLILGRLGLPRLELTGAGLASAIAHGFMFLVMLAIAVRVRPLRRYHILARFWRPDWRVFARIFRLGLPIAGIFLMEFGMIAGALIMLGWIGTGALAAHQIALQLAAITFKVPLGIAQASTVRVGLFVGRRDVAGVKRAGWTAMGLGVVFMGAMSLVMWTWPETLVGVFLDTSDPANAGVVALAAALILVAAVFQIGDGAQTIGAGALRGLSDTFVPMAFAAFGYWVLGLGASYLLGFPLGLGAVGVWIGMAVGLISVAIFHVLRFRRLTRLGVLPELARD